MRDPRNNIVKAPKKIQPGGGGDTPPVRTPPPPPPKPFSHMIGNFIGILGTLIISGVIYIFIKRRRSNNRHQETKRSFFGNEFDLVVGEEVELELSSSTSLGADNMHHQPYDQSISVSDPPHDETASMNNLPYNNLNSLSDQPPYSPSNSLSDSITTEAQVQVYDSKSDDAAPV